MSSFPLTDELVDAWNVAVGFRQIILDQPDSSLKAFVKENIPSVQLVPFETAMLEDNMATMGLVLQVVPISSSSAVHSRPIFAGVRNGIVNVFGAERTKVTVDQGNGETGMRVIDLQQDFRILRGYKVVLRLQSTSQFAETILHQKNQKLALALDNRIECEGDIVVLRSNFEVSLNEYDEEEDTVFVHYPTGFCLDWSLAYPHEDDTEEEPYATITNLFYYASQESCSKLQPASTMSKGRGAWMLRLVDEVNRAANMSCCILEDASTFQDDAGNKCAARCIYSANQNGLSYYMSKGYLVGDIDDAPDEAVRQTNDTIREYVRWWIRHEALQERRQTRTVACNFKTSTLCKNFPVLVSDMIKFYTHHGKPMQFHIDIPANPFAPATVSIVRTSKKKISRKKKQ